MVVKISRAVLLAALWVPAAGYADDDSLLARIKAVGDGSKYDADSVVVLDETVVVVRPDGIGESTTRRAVKILRDSAIRRECVQRFSFDPTTNIFEPLSVRVFRADGAVEDVPLSGLIVQPEPQWGIFWGSQQALIGVPRLAIGDCVITEYRKTGFNVAYLRRAGEDDAAPAIPRPESLQPPMPGHWYDEVPFWSSVPIVEKRYVVRIGRERTLQFEVYNGELRVSKALDGDSIVYTFEKRDIPAFTGEGGMVATTDVACKLVLATLEDWLAKSRWFHEKNEPALEVDDEIRATVAQVVAGLKTDDEKITALNHWVAENIRYVGTSRGACEGYTTHNVVETFRDRGGVCKDKAGLLVAMLRVAGFDAYIVMTQAGSDVMPVPADQFNHAVACVRNAKGEFRLLDPTWMPKSRENWSSAEQLQHVVYGVPEGAPLTRSPYSGPEENAISWVAQSEITLDGGLRGTVEITADGAPDTALRRAFARARPEERGDLVAAAAARIAPGAAVTASQWQDPVDFSGPFRISTAVVADRFALGDNKQRFVRLPVLRMIFADTAAGDVLGAREPETRKYPLRMRSTRRLQFREKLTLPAGWRVAALPPSRQIEGPAASFSFSIEQTDGALSLQCRVDVKKHRVPPEELANLREVLTALDALAEQPLVCELAEQRVQSAP